MLAAPDGEDESMRPLRLELEGYTSWKKRVEVDFVALGDLFVIIGPTGAGKSSLLDAICLALYGKVPRASDDERRELISLGASEARVQLEFRTNGRTYRVARRFPRSGAQSVRLDRIEEDGVTVPEVENPGVREVNRVLEELLGLDFDAFTRVILLPQGEFAKLLRGKVAERKQLLSRLLDTDRVERAGKRARHQAQTLKDEAETQENVIREVLASATQEKKEELGAQVRGKNGRAQWA